MTEQKSYWGVLAPSRRELRNFGLIMAVILGLIAGYMWYREALESAQGMGIAAGIFGAIGLAFPFLLKPVYIAWMCLARILAFVNTHILLALVFYTLFTLIGGLMRLFGHDPLDRSLESEKDSYWVRREKPLLDPNHYEKQF